jgi:predicted metalloprotease with PDZ domain
MTIASASVLAQALVILSEAGILSARRRCVRLGGEAKNLSCSFASFFTQKRDSSRRFIEPRKDPCGPFARRAQNVSADPIAASPQSCHSEEARHGALFAPQGGTTRDLLFPAILRKSRSLVARPHEDMQASFLGMTTTKWSRSAPAIVAVLFALAVVLAAPAPARATIRYEISLAHPAEHQFHVTMTVPNALGDLVAQMPAWNALYQIRDFAYRVTDFRAADAGGNSLAVHRLDKETWRIEVSKLPLAGRAEIRIEYNSFWDDPGPFDTQLNNEHAFINPAMILCYIPERRGEDTSVQFRHLVPGWRVAMELRHEGPQAIGEPSYQAESYDALVDVPVEIGRFDEWSFQAGSGPTERTIRIVYHGDAVDRSALTRMLSEIVNYETRLMGDAPFPEYTFILHVGQNYGGGGMEHANSTAISVGSYATLANVSAHEFFHLWNVKRISPQSLEPVDYTREMWTPVLWFAEGVTSTYAAYTLERTGIWNHTQFLTDLGSQITELESRPARAWQSAEESSLDTWFDRYPLYDRPDFSISYYNKGQLLGIALDILIRDATDNRASLDDVLRRLNQQYAQRGRFYPDSAGIEEAVEEVVHTANAGSANPAAGDFPGFFKRYVSGTDEMPFADLLSLAGFALKTEGGKRAALGFSVGRDSAGTALVSDLDLSSAAARIGIREGDVIVSLDGADLPRNVERWLRGRSPGEMVRMRIRRGGRESEMVFALGSEAAQVFAVEEMPRPSERQLRIRNGLFQGTTERAPAPR